MRVWRGDPRRWGTGKGRGAVLGVGVFDGVHRGHRTVMARVLALARSGDLRSAAVTFDVHPRSVVSPALAPRMLTTIEHRLELIESLGIDEVGVLPFASIRRLQPDEFAHLVVVDAFDARAVIVGANFRFGAGRSGDVRSLRGVGRIYGFTVDPQPLLEGTDIPISSTLIRRCIAEGEVAMAADLLGRPHELRASLDEGDLSASRACPRCVSLRFSRSMALPPAGLYAVWAVIEGEKHPALGTVHPHLTPQDTDESVRLHILDRSGAPGALRIGVRFVERLYQSGAFEEVSRSATCRDHDLARARRMLEPARGPGPVAD